MPQWRRWSGCFNCSDSCCAGANLRSPVCCKNVLEIERVQAQQKWGDLTDDDLDKIDGRREEVVGVIQERYGKDKEEAEREVQEFESSCNC
ncbi:hypothetical protein Pan54_31760 [Rubinisphaera italica]|uniref:CsbD-like domain-containing protein n=1 Tax=Rubinisphaera italica TaxID=2527969 RepID=A0A5C5XHZ9_9PLAN|nr:hypothetical protein Pan54_31760 [Rubinisphaera italica]